MARYTRYNIIRLIVPNPEDPYIADLLQVADSRIAELDGEVRRLNDEKDIIERKVKNFREQVSGKKFEKRH
jgi:centrosomal protein CEP135